jgi:hypothetical protein
MSDKQTRNMDTNELHNETAIKEVQQLLKNGTKNLSPDIINKLKTKYSDDSIVESIMDFFSDRRNKIIKVASIFIEAFQRKYKNDFYSMSLSKFMKRCLKYKKKYELSDEEFDEIRRIFEMKIFSSEQNLATKNVIYPNTNISRVLGYPVIESHESIKPTNPDDYSYLQDILTIYAATRNIHSFLVIQTMTYEDVSIEAMNGKFDPQKHDINRFIHPVLAALFLPKFKELEERMLYASIGGIIKARYNKERIITKPDYELFYSMVIDPADTVCDSISPIRDIKNRTEVQVQLWNNVYNLRNGKYYEPGSLDFLAYIDKCKISNIDNPDLIYLSDEGVILRRLFAVFSFRPIIVSTQPVFGMIINNPYNLPVNHNAITSIPYITYKLPQISIENKEYSLSDANNQIQYYMENGIFVPKITQILDYRGPVIFYVPRRFVGLSMNINPQLAPFNFTKLSNSTRHYNTINLTEINYEINMELNSPSITGKKILKLRSAIALDKYQNTQIIMGHITYIFKYNSEYEDLDSLFPDVSIYYPRDAFKSNNNPIRSEPDDLTKKALNTCGTIFIYN